jgi:hypothetical protein
MSNNSGSTITSTPNNFIQYRAIFSTGDTARQPQLNSVNIDYNDGFKVIKATDNNSVSLYNYTGGTQNMRLDVTVFGADLAEWYTVDDTTIGAGDVVALTGQMDEDGVPVLRKANSQNDPNIIGIISTNAGQTLGIQKENRRLLALAGRVPVKIDPTSPVISAGDGITSSETPGMARKASFGDSVIAKAAQSWKPGDGNTLFVIVNNSGSQSSYLASLEDFRLLKDLVTGSWQVISETTGDIAKNVGIFSDLIVANIKVGIATISELTTDKLAVKIISPVPGETDIKVQIGSTATPSGQFVIQDASGSAVAAIDNMGNATFSGTLYADNIKSQNIDDIQALLAKVETDQNILKDVVDWNSLTATNSASLDQIATADLYVTNQAAINSLSITNSLALGSDMIFGSDNTLNSLTAPLKIQSLAMAPIELMAGLITIDTKGNVNIAGNLYVAGRINSSGLTLKESEATSSATLLTLQDINGNTVSTVDSSGSAQFNNLTTGGLTIASNNLATTSALINGVISTNATAGQGVIPSGISEITIKNPKVTDYTLVYVTPTSSTQNYVLYVKSKENGKFVVGFTNPIDIDVNFNWWIVQIQN